MAQELNRRRFIHQAGNLTLLSPFLSLMACDGSGRSKQLTEISGATMGTRYSIKITDLPTRIDPALLADAKKLNWHIIPLVGEKVAEGIRRGLNQPPEIIAMLKEVQKSKPADVKTAGKLSQVNRGGREIVFTDAGGKTDKSKISGSRTTVKINGKGAKRSKLKVGMACAITYKGPGTEASLVDCK